jgi:AcrR family transcriptional regulator
LVKLLDIDQMVKYESRMSAAIPTAASPRAARTRAALIAAGFDLIAAKPIDAIPIDELVARAGVAKGSFFNHFADKAEFAAAIAAEVRCELEALVSTANAGIADPVARIAGGMRVCAGFALDQPKRSAVLLRSHGSSTLASHPLNQGLAADIAAADAAGQLRPEAAGQGTLFWLGLCQVLMINLLEDRPDRAAAGRRMADLMLLGLTGLGVPAATAAPVAAAAAAQLGA